MRKILLTILAGALSWSVGAQDVRQAEWGMGPNQVNSLEIAAGSELQQQTTTYYIQDWYGVPAYFEYSFTEHGALYQTEAFPAVEMSYDTAQQQYTTIYNGLSAQYGAGEYSGTTNNVQSYYWEIPRTQIIHDQRGQEWRTWFIQGGQE